MRQISVFVPDEKLRVGERFESSLGDQLICIYFLESEPSLSIRIAAEFIAEDRSVGTWTKLSVSNIETIRARALARVIRAYQLDEPNRGIVEIGFPIDVFDFEMGGIPHLLSITAGDQFILKGIKNLKLVDIIFPSQALKSFPGPKLGIPGLRALYGTEEKPRPHIGVIIKPRIGTTPIEFAQLCVLAAEAGADFVKDDELLFSPTFCPIEKRVEETRKRLDVVGSDTKYIVNVTAEASHIVKLAQRVIDCGADGLFVNGFFVGFSTLRLLRATTPNHIPIQVAKEGIYPYIRSPDFGIDLGVFIELLRLCGADEIYIDGLGGRCTTQEAVKLQEICKIMRSSYPNHPAIKPAMPLLTAGMHPGNVEINYVVLGNDISIQAGGGIVGHPGGIKAGVKAMRQIIDAVVELEFRQN